MTYEPSQAAIEAAANAMMSDMFLPHELPLPEDLQEKYRHTASAALIAAREVEDTLRVESPDHPATEGSPK